MKFLSVGFHLPRSVVPLKVKRGARTHPIRRSRGYTISKRRILRKRRGTNRPTQVIAPTSDESSGETNEEQDYHRSARLERSHSVD
jgi:hypothetical protein